MGAPSTFTEEIALTLCERIIEGESLRKICADDDMPAIRTVMKWLSDGKHPEFVQQYARAKEAQAETLAEEILEIADNGISDTYVDDDGKVVVNHDVIARSRLRVDSRKWLASKMAPKKYGDRLHQDINQTLTIQDISEEEIDRRIAQLISQAGIDGLAGGEGA